MAGADQGRPYLGPALRSDKATWVVTVAAVQPADQLGIQPRLASLQSRGGVAGRIPKHISPQRRPIRI